MNINIRASLLVLSACLLWAMDLQVRPPLAVSFNFATLIFMESFIGLLFLLPWILKQGRAEYRNYSKSDWGRAFFIGAIGMSAAGYLFNATIQKTSPGTFSFFQIFQPIIVIVAARLFLKEKFENSYVIWGFWIILSSLLTFSGDFHKAISSNAMFEHPKEALVALLVMFIWAMCTIVGKSLLQTHSALSVTTARWMFSMVMSSVFLVVHADEFDIAAFFHFDNLLRLSFISCIAGILSMWLYYTGLKYLPAWKVSVLELSYPALGMVFSSFQSFSNLGFLQFVGMLSFLTLMSLMMSKTKLSPTPNKKSSYVK